MNYKKEISKIKMLFDIFLYFISICISILLVCLFSKFFRINNILIVLLLVFLLWGFLNNLFNSIYFYFFARDKNIINNDTYVYEKYISRFNALDYTKKNTLRKFYGFHEWKYYSEYRLHQFFWYLLKKFYNDEKHSYLNNLAISAREANITYKESDRRLIVNLLVYIVGIFGL